MKKKVFKAVIPAAGFGTRMLPFTKAVPKELIPLVDTPVLEYVVQEAVDAGVTEILLIISPGKEAIREHFSAVPALADRLAGSGKKDLLKKITAFDGKVNISYAYQYEQKGLGDAVRLAADFAGNDPVLILLGDTVMDSFTERSVSAQLVDVYRDFGGAVIALEKVPPELVSRYGIASGREIAAGVLKLEKLVEKPALEDAPGDDAVAARYLLTPEIFRLLQDAEAGLHGEIQLTDSIAKLMKKENVYGCRIFGRRYDLGSAAGFVAANVEFALRRPDLQDSLGGKIVEILKKQSIKVQ